MPCANFFVAARKKAEMDVVSIDSAISNFIVENGGKAPENLEVLVTPDENGRTILKNRTTVPLDPWGNPYGYEPPTSNRDYRVFSYGKDGQPAARATTPISTTSRSSPRSRSESVSPRS